MNKPEFSTILKAAKTTQIAPNRKTTDVMEELMKSFNGKIQSLKFSIGKNDEVIASRNAEAISRHETLLMSKLQAVHTAKESIIELRFTEGETEEQVNTWAKEFDGFLEEADEKALALRQLVAKMEEEKRLAEKLQSGNGARKGETRGADEPRA